MLTKTRIRIKKEKFLDVVIVFYTTLLFLPIIAFEIVYITYTLLRFGKLKRSLLDTVLDWSFKTKWKILNQKQR